jgi:hypothetical protein
VVVAALAAELAVTARPVLVASPLLGGAAWEPVAGLLDAPVVCPRGSSAAEVLASLLAQLPEGEDLLLVPHSNAGLYAAAVAQQRPVRGVLFVDAGIPAADGPTATAPAGVLAFQRELADADGLLPPWTRWWPEQDVAPLFPSAAVRARVEADQPRLPVSYFSDELPAAPVPQRCAYLAFGDTYAEEISRAEAAGWPLSTIAGRHLHLLCDPPGVAAEIQRLIKVLCG